MARGAGRAVRTGGHVFEMTPEQKAAQAAKAAERQKKRAAEMAPKPRPPAKYKERPTKLAGYDEKGRTKRGFVNTQLRSNKEVLIPAGIVLPAAYAADRNFRKRDDRAKSHATAAGAAGLTGYAALGHATRHRGNKKLRQFEDRVYYQARIGNRGPLQDYQETMRTHRKKHNLAGNPGTREHFEAVRRNPASNRDYPSHLPNAPHKKLLGNMSGRRGIALGTAAAGIPAAGAYAHAKKKNKVGKRDWGYNEKRVSPLRATEAAVGISLVGYGLSRNSAFKNALRVGQKMSGNKGIIANHAERARAVTEQHTGAGARMIQQKTGYTGRGLRPIESLVAGGVVTHHALPIRRERFTPVQQGW